MRCCTKRASKRRSSNAVSSSTAVSSITIEPNDGTSPFVSPEPTHARISNTKPSRTRVDGRVRHLRELLAQIGSNRHAALEIRLRGVVAHREHRLAGTRSDDVDDILEFVFGVAETHEIAIDRRIVRRSGQHGLRQREFPRLHDRAEVSTFAPFRAVLLGRDDLVRCETHHEPVARAEPPALHDRIVAEVDDAGFRCRQHFARFRPAPAHRPETAAVEGRTNGVAVGKHDGRRAVPRFKRSGCARRKTRADDRPTVRPTAKASCRPLHRCDSRHRASRRSRC